MDWHENWYLLSKHGSHKINPHDSCGPLTATGHKLFIQFNTSTSIGCYQKASMFDFGWASTVRWIVFRFGTEIHITLRMNLWFLPLSIQKCNLSNWVIWTCPFLDYLGIKKPSSKATAVSVLTRANYTMYNGHNPTVVSELGHVHQCTVDWN